MVTATRPTAKPKKIRTKGPDGKMLWLTPEEMEARQNPPAVVMVTDVWEQDFAPEPELEPDEDRGFGPRPDYTAPTPPPPQDFPVYYHAYLPNLTIRRGRPDEIRFRGGVYTPPNEGMEERVREALAQYVPGGDVDRWKGDTLFDRAGNPRELRCRECGFFTGNDQVYDDHLQHTKH